MKAQPPVTLVEKIIGAVAAVSPILGLIAVAALMGDCQTRITAEKFPEQIIPVYINGGSATNYIVASGGWYMTARSPLWADETLKGLKLDIGRGANHVGFELADYSRPRLTSRRRSARRSSRTAAASRLAAYPRLSRASSRRAARPRTRQSAARTATAPSQTELQPVLTQAATSVVIASIVRLNDRFRDGAHEPFALVRAYWPGAKNPKAGRQTKKERR